MSEIGKNICIYISKSPSAQDSVINFNLCCQALLSDTGSYTVLSHSKGEQSSGKILDMHPKCKRSNSIMAHIITPRLG